MTAAAGPDTLAAGWATVDLDRAARELAGLLAPGETFETAPDCLLLGARCRVGRAGPGPAAPPLVVLLEPSTEGRLAASLARHGEAWCATWEQGGAAGRRASAELPGPLGPERLVLGDPVTGPYRLLARAATIRT